MCIRARTVKLAPGPLRTSHPPTPASMRLLAVNCCQSLMGRSVNVIIYTTFTDYTMYTVTTDRYAKAKVGIK